ncbi:MAG: GNAT family N-acetyltransferase [Candidatus Bathyarchaeota archaeon]|nr:MAG: GNAT family N-acetyltransferase [Candidatus Bathyarchaeota archaeon]
MSDIPVLLDFRGRMFRSMIGDSFDYGKYREFDKKFFERNMEDEGVIVWVVESKADEVVAGVAVSFYDLPPKPWNTEGRYAHIFNLYTDPDHRRKGLASKLMQASMKYAESIGVPHVTLHTSDMGKPLFLSLGFEESNEMSIVVDSPKGSPFNEV